MSDIIDLKAEENLPGWEIYSYSSNIVQMHIPIEGTIKIKSFCTLSKGKKDIMNFLKIEAELMSIFEVWNKENEEYKFELNLPAGVCKRKGKVRKIELPDDSGIVLKGSMPGGEPPDGVVYVNANYFGFLIEEIGNSMSKLWFMCELQLGGTLPGMAIEMVKRDLAVIPRKFKDKIKGKPPV